jgi:hypothetical protein
VGLRNQLAVMTTLRKDVLGVCFVEVRATVARPLIIRITISGAFLALNCENQLHAFGT